MAGSGKRDSSRRLASYLRWHGAVKDLTGGSFCPASRNSMGLDCSTPLAGHDHTHVQPGVLALVAYPPVTSAELLITVGSVFAGSRFIFICVPKKQQKRDDNEYNENPKPVPSFLVLPFLASLLLRRHCWKVVRVSHCPIVGIGVSPYRGSSQSFLLQACSCKVRNYTNRHRTDVFWHPTARLVIELQHHPRCHRNRSSGSLGFHNAGSTFDVNCFSFKFVGDFVRQRL